MGTKHIEKGAILSPIVRAGGNGQMARFGLEFNSLFEYSLIHLCDLGEE